MAVTIQENRHDPEKQGRRTLVEREQPVCLAACRETTGFMIATGKRRGLLLSDCQNG